MSYLLISSVGISLMLILFVIVPALTAIRRSYSRMCGNELSFYDKSQGMIYMDQYFGWRSRTGCAMLMNSFLYEKKLQGQYNKRCAYSLLATFVINLGNVLLMDSWDTMGLWSKALVSLVAVVTIVSLLVVVYYQCQVMCKEHSYQDGEGTLTPTTTDLKRRLG